MTKYLDALFTRLSGRWMCALFLIASIIPSLLFTHLFHNILIGPVSARINVVTVLTTLCVSTPLVLTTVHSFKRLARSKRTLRQRSEALDTSVAQLADARNKLRTVNDQLEQKVRERTAAAEEARLTAEEASRAKSMFLANMSHELRTPLNAIIGFSDMVKHREVLNLPDTDATTDEYANSINSAGRHLLSLVNDLLDLSRIDCGQFDIIPERLRVEAVIEAVVSNLSIIAQQRNQVIEVNIDCGSQFFFADARASHQILINLLSNALKFSEEGTTVTITATDDAFGTTYEVIDRGPGISDKDAETAVLPFERLSEAHIASGQSIGLGLSIVSSLCTLHGGTLKLQKNDDGIGTLARVTFPNLTNSPQISDGAKAQNLTASA